MWPKGTIAVVALAGLLWPSPVLAQAPAPTPILAGMARNGYLRFQVTSGRITLTGRRYGSHSLNSTTSGRSEKLKMRVVNGQRSMTYERTTGKEQLTVELTDSQEFRIRRIGLGDSTPGDGTVVPLDFSQAPDQPTTLALGAGAEQEVYRAAGLWHLLIARRRQCRKHLIPVLKLLRPDWKLAELAEAVEVQLRRMAAAGQTPDRRQWAAWIAQLADDRFSKREAADRRLRAAGTALLGYLRQLDFAQLDAEQQYRVRRIIKALSQQAGDDLPETVARRLLADETVWLALLDREDESSRRQAAQQLSDLLGKEISFDAAADARTRAAQIEKIRARIGGE